MALPVLSVLGLKWIEVVVIVAALVMMAVLYLFVMRSRIGTAIRAVSEDKQTAALMGIDVNRAIVTTFAVGAAMAGAAGVLYGSLWGIVYFFSGFIPGIKAFTAAVLGGIGNIPGAMVGGFVLGEAEAIGSLLFFDGLGVPSPEPAQGRHRLHHPRHGADVPAPGHPGRAPLEVAGMTAGPTTTTPAARCIETCSAWKQVFIVGLLFGGAALYVTLVGIVGTFEERAVIDDVITVGQLVLLLTAIIAGYVGAVKAPPGAINRIIGSAVAGLMSGAALSLLILIGPALDLGEYLPNASRDLYDLISGAEILGVEETREMWRGEAFPDTFWFPPWSGPASAHSEGCCRCCRAWRATSSSSAAARSWSWVSSPASCAPRCCSTS